jgi:hypothetical protein
VRRTELVVVDRLPFCEEAPDASPEYAISRFVLGPSGGVDGKYERFSVALEFQDRYDDCTFVAANGRLILDARRKRSKYNQDALIDNLAPALNQVRTGNGCHKGVPTLIVHMDNSMFQNGAKITEKMS